ncbi:hypothetical protein BC829DRAFT_444733 [Chytridium lagenaria]|nr:hypothetical protein BC829DRAFT_444733 [Chytridium lagenaria]
MSQHVIARSFVHPIFPTIQTVTAHPRGPGVLSAPLTTKNLTTVLLLSPLTWLLDTLSLQPRRQSQRHLTITHHHQPTPPTVDTPRYASPYYSTHPSSYSAPPSYPPPHHHHHHQQQQHQHHHHLHHHLNSQPQPPYRPPSLDTAPYPSTTPTVTLPSRPVPLPRPSPNPHPHSPTPTLHLLCSISNPLPPPILSLPLLLLRPIHQIRVILFPQPLPSTHPHHLPTTIPPPLRLPINPIPTYPPPPSNPDTHIDDPPTPPLTTPPSPTLTRARVGARPYKCPLDACQSIFSRRYNMVQHFRTHAQRLGIPVDAIERGARALKTSPPGSVPAAATNKGLLGV